MKIIPLKRLIYGLLGLCLMVPMVSFVDSTETQNKGLKIIVLDPGHGGQFHGANGAGYYTGDWYAREQDVTLQVAMRLGKAIEASMPGVKVIYTRTTDTQLAETNPRDLRERINIANRAKADLWISIHCNSMGLTRYVKSYRTVNGRKTPVYGTRVQSPSTKGTETFVAGSGRLDEQDAAIGEYATLREDYKEDAALDPKDPESSIITQIIKNDLRKKSIQLASLIQDEYIAVGRVNRGFQEQSLAVLRTATMPAVLTEIGFISNQEEEQYITSEAGQTEIVNCLLKAIQNYQADVYGN